MYSYSNDENKKERKRTKKNEKRTKKNQKRTISLEINLNIIFSIIYNVQIQLRTVRISHKPQTEF